MLLIILKMFFISACVTVDIPRVSLHVIEHCAVDWLPSVVLLISRNIVEALISSSGKLCTDLGNGFAQDEVDAIYNSRTCMLESIQYRLMQNILYFIVQCIV